MEISIDEAGTFVVKGASKNSWCVVVALACPETEKIKCQKLLLDLKLKENIKPENEIKLRQTKEKNYFQFLKDLGDLDCILFAVATDSNLNRTNLVVKHQTNQALAFIRNVDEMKYENGKRAMRYLASQLNELPAQLYVQLMLQIELMRLVVVSGINFFVQRNPNSLKSFCWRIDQKEPYKKIDFEYAFERCAPPILQAYSLESPRLRLGWCDYEPMAEFMYKKGEVPDYLIEKYPRLKNKGGLDIQKIISKDIKFLDSKEHLGIQVADLLASGLRRLLRQKYTDNNIAAFLLGRLMVQDFSNKPPLKLMTFGERLILEDNLANLIKIMIKSCKPMLKTVVNKPAVRN